MHNSFYCHDIAAAVGKFVELEYRAFWRDRALPLSPANSVRGSPG